MTIGAALKGADLDGGSNGIFFVFETGSWEETLNAGGGDMNGVGGDTDRFPLGDSFLILRVLGGRPRMLTDLSTT